ncbi:GM11755 [Drosophila sechellia]|uniref:GM11755 n=1 Tax=Drosophila sechellia TaxID=7238 RepID=B4IL31_DROSE|nr:GM11755 [Drosophila sechellia]
MPYSASSVAAKIMAKYGFKDGQGLGKSEQGMAMALQVEKTSKRGGRIIHEKDVFLPPLALSPPAICSQIGTSPSHKAMPPPQMVGTASESGDSITEIMKSPSKVVLLRNMVGPGDVDEELEPEVKDECNTKYGEVNSVIIHESDFIRSSMKTRLFTLEVQDQLKLSYRFGDISVCGLKKAKAIKAGTRQVETPRNLPVSAEKEKPNKLSESSEDMADDEDLDATIIEMGDQTPLSSQELGMELDLLSNEEAIPADGDLEFLTRDCVPIVVEDVGAAKKTVVASVYFAGDEACPPPEITALAEYCKRTRGPIIIGCDANAHHVIWGSSDVNQRGLNLECSERRRNPRNTNWEEFNASLLRNPASGVTGKLLTTLELEAAVEDINSCLTNAFRENCSLGRAKREKDAPWWNDQLEKLRKATRRLFNKAKREGNWDAYRNKLTMYNHEIRKAK